MKNWDVFIRVNHWLVALLFFSNYFIFEEGEVLHEWVGYLVFALIFARIIWSFLGRGAARLSSFYPTFSAISAHIKLLKLRQWRLAEEQHNSHNPLGAMMVLFLWFMLLACSTTGYMQTLDAFWGEEWLHILHELSAKLVLFAVAVHVVSVIGVQTLSGHKLIQAMLWR